jgi:hypothetical protein
MQPDQAAFPQTQGLGQYLLDIRRTHTLGFILRRRLHRRNAEVSVNTLQRTPDFDPAEKLCDKSLEFSTFVVPLVPC